MLRRAALYWINFYQRHIRGLLPQVCRFAPSCSEYARAAVVKYGFFKGGGKALIRLLRCHPFSAKSGYDPLE